MRKISGALPKTIAVARMATSVFFLLFGQYKIFGPEFTHGGFQENLQGFIQNGAVSFYKPVLANLVLPHAVFLDIWSESSNCLSECACYWESGYGRHRCWAHCTC